MMVIIIIIVVVFFPSRILSNLQCRPGGILLYKEVYNRYREYELFEQGTPVDSVTFGATILHIYLTLENYIGAKDSNACYSTLDWHSSHQLTLPSTTIKYHH